MAEGMHLWEPRYSSPLCQDIYLHILYGGTDDQNAMVSGSHQASALSSPAVR